MNITGDRKASRPRPAPGTGPTIGTQTGSIESREVTSRGGWAVRNSAGQQRMSPLGRRAGHALDWPLVARLPMSDGKGRR